VYVQGGERGQIVRGGSTVAYSSRTLFVSVEGVDKSRALGTLVMGLR